MCIYFNNAGEITSATRVLFRNMPYKTNFQQQHLLKTVQKWKCALTYVWCCKNTEIQHILRSTSCRLCNCVLYMSKAKFPTQYWLKRAPAPWFGTTPIRPRNHSAATVLGRHSTISLPLRGIHTAQVIYGTWCQCMKMTFVFLLPLPFLTIGTHSLVSTP